MNLFFSLETNLFFSLETNLFIILLLVSSFNLLGGYIAYRFLPKIKANEKAWHFFSAFLMLVLAFDLLAFQIIHRKLTESSLSYPLSGFVLGFSATFILMTLYLLLAKKGINSPHDHRTLGILLFLLLAVHELSEGFGIAEIFHEVSYLPLKFTLFPVAILGLHEFPEGILLVLPFFLSKRIRSGLLALISNQLIFIVSGGLAYFFILRVFELNVGQEAFISSFPAGGIFFLGVHDFVIALKIPEGIKAFSRFILVGVSLLVIAIISASLILTDNHVEEVKRGEVSNYEINPETGARIPVIYADPCEHQFSLEECLR